MRIRTLAVMTLTLVGCGQMQMTPVDAGDMCAGGAKTPANLLQNPGFECSRNPEQWVGSFSFDLASHSGGKSAKLVADAAGTVFLGIDSVAKPTTATTYCMTLWAKGTAPAVRLSGLTSPQAMMFSNPLSGDTWVRVPPTTVLKVPVAANAGLAIKIAPANAAAGDTVFIDDVDVWESTTDCKETR